MAQDDAGAVSTAPSARFAALDAHLARREEQGFRVETRSERQAVIVRRHPLHFAYRWIAKDRAEQRLVISIDEHGEVAVAAAQPLRW